LNKMRVVVVVCAFLLLMFVTAPLVQADWPMFHSDPTHSGVATGNAQMTATVQWSYTTGGAVASSPAIVNGVVYFGSYDGNVYALNANTGALIWKYATGNQIEKSSPAVVNNIVYIGSDDDNVYALNAATGAKIWTYTTGAQVESSPTVVNGVVYVGSNDGKLYALDASSGAYLWAAPLRGLVVSAPTVVNGVVYVGSIYSTIFALSASSGTQIWNFSTGAQIQSTPLVANGMVYVGSEDWKIYALDASSGALVWSFTTGGVVDSSPALSGSDLYIGSCDGHVYDLNAATGTQIWNYSTSYPPNGSPTGTTTNSVESSPAVVGNVVYVGNDGYYVYALDATTGAKIWSYATQGSVISSPAFSGEVVYVGSNDDKLYAFGGSPSTTPTATAAPTASVAPSPTPTSTLSTVTATTANGGNVDLSIAGSITSSQMSNISIEANQSAETTTLSFTLTGQSGTTGSSNITIPISAIQYGTSPRIYIDGQLAASQGFIQDNSNYYVWYTTHFSTHQIAIVFTKTSHSGSNVPEFSPLNLGTVLAAVATISIMAVMIAKRNNKQLKGYTA